jgi:hypothetical protein
VCRARKTKSGDKSPHSKDKSLAYRQTLIQFLVWAHPFTHN